MKEKEKEKLAFSEEDRQQLIDYYKEHPMLWNSQLKDYRNRDLRRVNFERLARQLDSRYSVEKIQQEWHNLTTYFDRERMRMEGSKKSGAGSDEVYQTSWPYYTSMEFCLDKSNPDDTVSTLNHIAPVPKKKTKNDYEEKKAKLWEVLGERFSTNTSNIHSNTWKILWQQGFQAGFQQAWQQCSQMFMQQQMPNFLGSTSVRSTPTGRANNHSICKFNLSQIFRSHSKHHRHILHHQDTVHHHHINNPRYHLAVI